MAGLDLIAIWSWAIDVMCAVCGLFEQLYLCGMFDFFYSVFFAVLVNGSALRKAEKVNLVKKKWHSPFCKGRVNLFYCMYKAVKIAPTATKKKVSFLWLLVQFFFHRPLMYLFLKMSLVPIQTEMAGLLSFNFLNFDCSWSLWLPLPLPRQLDLAIANTTSEATQCSVS